MATGWAWCVFTALEVSLALLGHNRGAWAQVQPDDGQDVVPPRGPAAAAAAGGAAATAPGPRPPTVLAKVDAIYPAAELVRRQAALVVLRVTVAADGRVTAIEIVQSGGSGFDAAAIAAIGAWRFAPARLDGVAVAARIRVPFRFEPPAEAATSPAAVSTPEAATPSAPTPRAAPTTTGTAVDEPTLEVRVKGQRQAPARAVSDVALEREVLAVVPRASAGELLGTAPGVYVARPEGDAVAHQVFLRGFDAEHGQDIAFSVGGVPVNQPSHLHGQGYADLNFVIPDVVRTLRVREGVYDPRQGDFAVAGSVDFDLAVAERGTALRATGGSFGTQGLSLVVAPKAEADETFAAVSLRRTDGFGSNRGALSGALMAQFVFEGPGDVEGRVLVVAQAARAGLAGVLRQDDIDAGLVDRLGTYDNPSATAQSALASRTQVALELTNARAAGDRTSLLIWAALVDFRSRANFTGFVQRSQQNPAWVGRGDLIEQANHDRGLGATLAHRSAWKQLAEGLRGQFEAGLSVRNDAIDQTQALLMQPQNQTWDRRVDASITTSDLGSYLDADLHLGERWHVRGGGRVDLLAFDVDDRLGNWTPSFQKQTHLPGFRRTAAGVALGPRVAIEMRPSADWQLHVGLGRGYRSPQARLLEEGESAPFATVLSTELGAKWAPGRGERVQLALAAFGTSLSTDLIFDPGEGQLERVGPSTRLGVVGHALLHPWPWLVASASCTWVRATLDAPPPATAQEPVPSLQAGQQLPYVPPAVARLDLAARHGLGTLRGATLHGQVGSSVTWMSARPLPYRGSTPALTLVDAAASLRWRALELGLQVSNLLDTGYAATAYSFVSDWQTTPLPSLVPATHVAAGAPRTVLATLALLL